VLIEATPAFPQAGFSTRKIVVPVTSDLAIRIFYSIIAGAESAGDLDAADLSPIGSRFYPQVIVAFRLLFNFPPNCSF
jgi:hypothetical protein